MAELSEGGGVSEFQLVAGTVLWRAPVESNHLRGGGFDMGRLPAMPIRYTQTFPRRVERPAGFALWGARRGWVQVGSQEDRDWTAWAGYHERTFGLRHNLRAAVEYIRRRYGLATGSGAGPWHVHVSDHYRTYAGQRSLYRSWLSRRGERTIRQAVRLRRVVAAINETGRGAEEVQWEWPR